MVAALLLAAAGALLWVLLCGGGAEEVELGAADFCCVDDGVVLDCELCAGWSLSCLNSFLSSSIVEFGQFVTMMCKIGSESVGKEE